MRSSIKSSLTMTNVSLVLLLALVGQQVAATADLAAGLGLAAELGHLSNNPLKDVGNLLNNVGKPITGILGTVSDGLHGSEAVSSLGGLVTGLAAATGLGMSPPKGPSAILGAESLASRLGAESLASRLGAANAVSAVAAAARGAGMREAAATAGGSYLRGSSTLGSGLNTFGASNAYHRESASASEQAAYSASLASSAVEGAVSEAVRGPVGLHAGGSSSWNSGISSSTRTAAAAAAAAELAGASSVGDLSTATANAAFGSGVANAAYGAGATAAASAGALGAADALGAAGALSAASALGIAGSPLGLPAALGASRVPGVGIGSIPALPATPAEHVINGIIPASQILSRQALATEALNNAQAESAIAGADMVAHGANNARSASLASNAYRQAKLASARDRVNIAGTIQNSARISDAAIATHDAATKAEDSLLGSELAVDSAATVLDSDAAYIPPVTNSMLRSLPYGRLGLRNIVPKPLTYPSVVLPDVWLNGVPVNYLNVPLRKLPYGIGQAAQPYQLQASGIALASGQIINGQPFFSNNGMLINGMVVDPTWAYLTNNMVGIGGSSIIPILANGQLEAQDEVAVANAVTLEQQTGAGQAATYQGFGRLNPVPMLTGSISDVNLAPTTTIGTTYPIGSALVIEPRDSYFQDYVDNASSRQNFDEHQQ